MDSANSPAVGRNSDGFVKSAYRFFDGLLRHSRGVMILLGATLLILVVVTLMMGKREKSSAEARDALFRAQKKYDLEMKALAPPAPKVDAKATSKKDEAKPLPPPAVDDTEFKPFDVNAKMPETVKAFRQVIDQYPGSRSGYDARMALGHLYLQHGQAALAEEWLSQAAATSPRGVERELSLMALGYAREEQGKLKEALDSFNQALATGQDASKGDLLMAIARCYESLHDLTNARATYDKVIAQLPNTEHARNAELYKSQAQ
jgi:tetratricopeptide (TPR) repeat protein